VTYEEFASDLPVSRTIVFTSVEENEDAFIRCGVEQPMRQLGKGAYRSDLAVRSTEQADLYADRYNKALSMYLDAPKGSVGLLFPRSANGQFLACGQNLTNQNLLVIRNGSGADIVIPDRAGSEAFTMSEARFIEMTEVLCPTYVRPVGMAVIEGNTTQLQALRLSVLNLVAHQEVVPNHEQVANLLEATITLIGYSSGQRQPECLLTNAGRVNVAKLTQEFIEEKYCEAVRMEDLCRATGVGIRTLQRSFREYFDLTITDYLRTVRLDAAHRELAGAHVSRSSVTQIALRHGFSHLGRFSAQFRERFGQSPRETLAMRAILS